MNISQKKFESEKINAEIKKFLKQGGQINYLPRGYSGETHSFNNRASDSKRTMNAVMAAAIASSKARQNNPNVIARKEAQAKGLKRYHGASCRNCGSTEKYVSTNSCYYCDRATKARKAKKEWNA